MNIILEGKNEFYPKLNNKKYYIYKIDSNDKEIKMNEIINNFINNQNKNINEKHFLGIDFEFNKISKGDRDVALMQFNIENDSNIGYIFIIYPPDLNNKDILLKLLTHENIYKILHGSESLDIPYLFNQLLITHDNINNFCKKFYDTKYLCDYNNLDNNIKQKCSIYELLIFNNIITNEKLEELNKMNDLIGPLYLININIYNLDDNLFKYSLYDVLYLPDLLKKYLSKNIIYTKLIPEILILIFKYKRNVEDHFIKIEKYVNNLNLAYYNDNNYKTFLINIWEIYYHIYSNDIYKLKEINFFKHFFEIITKFIIYNNIINYFTIYKNNNIINNNYYNNSNLFKWLSNNYPNLFDVINKFNNYIIKDFDFIIESLN